MAKSFLVTTLVFAFIRTTTSVSCYSCTNVTDDHVCTSNITTCDIGQSCFKSIKIVNDVVRLSLGCVDNQQCLVNTDISSLVGRQIYRRQIHNCIECCSSNMCNIHLCDHPKPTSCIDDETMDCAKMNSIFGVCKDMHHAKNICPEFCGLCNVVDGEWSVWSGWSACSVSCNNGTSTRKRTCTNPSPAYGGLECVGRSTDVQACTMPTLCPVHGGWSTWYNWGLCSVSCDTGIQTRNRLCTNPKPNHLGEYCIGPNVDDRLCIKGVCADGGWSVWSSWSSCSSTCREHTGIRTQSRSCNNPAPSVNGQYCVGDALRVDTCIADRYCHIYSDCSETKRHHYDAEDGVYDVVLWKSNRTIQVYCDMTTDGGGWTVFQYRFNGTVDFYRNYSQYIHGFGDVHSEFWLGLDFIQEMTSQNVNELRIDLMAANGTTAYEVFSTFSLSGTDYVLNVGKPTSSNNIDNSDYPFTYHDGYPFSTYDHDVDSYSNFNSSFTSCATYFHAGWWYNDCYYANLNGKYVTPGTQDNYNGIHYQSFSKFTLEETKMSFRRRQA